MHILKIMISKKKQTNKYACIFIWGSKLKKEKRRDDKHIIVRENYLNVIWNYVIILFIFFLFSL
jgi:hypothetical protein